MGQSLTLGMLRSKPSLPDLAYETLREAILSGRFDFGESLRQEKLAAQFGISRLPVREALSRLAAEGLVELRPRRGYVVASLDHDEIEDIYDIRALLEGRAGYLAATHRTNKDVAEVTALLERLDKIAATKAPDINAYRKANRAFHERLFAASGRAQLCKTLTMMRDSVDRYLQVGERMGLSLEHSQREHAAIVSAFRRGDAAAAERLCRQHCERTGRRLLEYLRRDSNPAPASAPSDRPRAAKRRSAA